MRSMYIDGDIFIVEGGLLERFTSGKSDGWVVGDPQDQLLRPTTTVDLVTGSGERRTGTIYAFDRRNARILAFDKDGGQYVAQYRLANGATGWKDLRGMYVIPGVDDVPATLVWLAEGTIHQSSLTAVPDDGSSPSAPPSVDPSAGTDGSAEPSVDASPAP